MRNLIIHLKTFFWWFEAPIHPYIRDGLLALHLIHHHGRQPFHIGYLAEGKTAEQFRAYLITQRGFEDHFPCWLDDGETVDLRFRQNFDWQYHLRIFSDGEVRGHHEYTPESKPISHLMDRESTACTREFMYLLGTGWVEQGERSKKLMQPIERCFQCKKLVYPSIVEK